MLLIRDIYLIMIDYDEKYARYGPSCTKQERAVKLIQGQGTFGGNHPFSMVCALCWARRWRCWLPTLCVRSAHGRNRARSHNPPTRNILHEFQPVRGEHWFARRSV